MSFLKAPSLGPLSFTPKANMTAVIPSPETCVVDDMHTLMTVLFSWHSQQIAKIQHMKSLPKDVEVSINDLPAETMTADMHKGFVLGLEYCLSELGNLPFFPADQPHATTQVH